MTVRTENGLQIDDRELRRGITELVVAIKHLDRSTFWSGVIMIVLTVAITALTAVLVWKDFQ